MCCGPTPVPDRGFRVLDAVWRCAWWPVVRRRASDDLLVIPGAPAAGVQAPVQRRGIPQAGPHHRRAVLLAPAIQALADDRGHRQRRLGQHGEGGEERNSYRVAVYGKDASAILKIGFDGAQGHAESGKC